MRCASFWAGLGWAGLGWAGLIMTAGCSRSIPESELSAILADTAVSPGASRAEAHEFDFGPVLARGQALHHEFTFTNHTDRPVRVLGTMALTPCCSAIGPVSPATIAPGGLGRVPVTLKVGTESERKGVQFIVRTDSKDRPALTYTLLATLYPEWEIQPLDEPPETLPTIRRAGRKVLRVTTSRVNGEGGDLPSQLKAGPTFSATFLGPPGERTDASGVVSRHRDVEIILPSAPEPGAQQGRLVFQWPDGRERAHALHWSVVLPIQASPRYLVLKRSERDVLHTVLIRSANQPFRVLSVDSPHPGASLEFTPESSRTHTLKVRVDPDQVARAQEPRITVHTDHPDQPTLPLKLLVLDQGE